LISKQKGGYTGIKTGTHPDNPKEDHMFKKFAMIAFVALSLVGIAACTDPIETEIGTIVDVAIENGSFETLVAALTEAELVTALEAEGPFTVFAPNDDAFTALLTDLSITAEDLLANPDLADILLYHVVSGEFLAADVIAASPFEVETLGGQMLSIEVIDGNVFVNGAQVILADVTASNGVIHVIDSVLMPPAPEEPQTIVDVAVENGSFTTLVAALTEAGLVSALEAEGPFTVFAPNDEAFTALLTDLSITAEDLLANPDLADILLYHVVSGEFLAADVIAAAPFEVATLDGRTLSIEVIDGNVFVNGAQVILADVTASNGVIHVIDYVLLPPAEEEPAA
jgi:transforming growth factor-beta-induced protein